MIYRYPRYKAIDGIYNPHQKAVFFHALISAYECELGCMHHKSNKHFQNYTRIIKK